MSDDEEYRPRRKRPTCRETGKLCWPDYYDAIRAAWRTARQDGESMADWNAYVCSCGWWHAGHVRRSDAEGEEDS